MGTGLSFIKRLCEPLVMVGEFSYLFSLFFISNNLHHLNSPNNHWYCSFMMRIAIMSTGLNLDEEING